MRLEWAALLVFLHAARSSVPESVNLDVAPCAAALAVLSRLVCQHEE